MYWDAVDNVTLTPESVVVLDGGEVDWVEGVPANGTSSHITQKQMLE